MFTRNQLVHAVIWPTQGNGMVSLIDTDGVEQASFPVSSPVRGSELSKMIPDGLLLDADNCFVVTMSGDIVVRTVGEFDTAVVTERAEVSFEDRMQRLERRERRREAREKKLAEENQRLREELEAEPVIENDDFPELKPDENGTDADAQDKLAAFEVKEKTKRDAKEAVEE